MDENKIVIVSDDGNKINFNDITIKNDDIDRNEVTEVENAIVRLKNENADFESRIFANNEQIQVLEDKLTYAKKVIAIADAQAAAKAETEQENVPVESNNDEIQDTEFENEED